MTSGLAIAGLNEAAGLSSGNIQITKSFEEELEVEARFKRSVSFGWVIVMQTALQKGVCS